LSLPGVYENISHISFDIFSWSFDRVICV